MTTLSSVLEESETTESNLEKESTALSARTSIDFDGIIQEIVAISDKKEENVPSRPSDLKIWQKIEEEFEAKRRAIREYKQLKEKVPPSNIFQINRQY